uniref:DNA_MISMATCH_REPAIR_2 domain-containing protein n=1 Tax=Panagrellus redivivus TaxID=6233 RepID=A0A7E4W3D9_PANRE
MQRRIHSLSCDLVKENKNVRLAHMNFIVENENTEDPTEEDVSFLYKLVDGVCKKSYGFFAAKLAGLPTQLVKEASEAGQLLQKQQERMRATQAARNA